MPSPPTATSAATPTPSTPVTLPADLTVGNGAGNKPAKRKYNRKPAAATGGNSVKGKSAGGVGTKNGKHRPASNAGLGAANAAGAKRGAGRTVAGGGGAEGSPQKLARFMTLGKPSQQLTYLNMLDIFFQANKSTPTGRSPNPAHVVKL